MPVRNDIVRTALKQRFQDINRVWQQANDTWHLLSGEAQAQALAVRHLCGIDKMDVVRNYVDHCDEPLDQEALQAELERLAEGVESAADLPWEHDWTHMLLIELDHRKVQDALRHSDEMERRALRLLASLED